MEEFKTLEEVIEKIWSFTKLPKDWDTYNSPPPSEPMAQEAEAVVCMMFPTLPSKILPTAGGDSIYISYLFKVNQYKHCYIECSGEGLFISKEGRIYESSIEDFRQEVFWFRLAIERQFRGCPTYSPVSSRAGPHGNCCQCRED